MVDEVSSVSQQTAAEASNVSAATEEQTASLSEVANNVQQMSKLAETLHNQVSKFEIQDGSTDRETMSADRTTGTAGAAQADGGQTSTTEFSGGRSRESQ
jgi:methyl-accepting chemotaxis protein